jgi:flagellar biosynthesis protein FlhF
VGKTTTLAKLAATFKLRDKKKVALVTIDTYRIAAVDQLRTYANIIKVPLHVVLSPEELSDALAQCRGYDVVLIDTAGRSQRDCDRLDDLRQFIAMADPHEVHLVLSSTASQQVLEQAVDRFTKVRIDRIIFTKLDEAVSFGVLLNVVRRVNKQLSYVTTGQEVPHQIEPGRSERLADLILGQGL